MKFSGFKSKFCIVLINALILIVLLGIAELGCGYALFQHSWSESSALSYLARTSWVGLTRNIDFPDVHSMASELKVYSVYSEKNPFVMFNRQEGFKYHPLIDFSGVHHKSGEALKLDYFGFRNEDDLYFKPKSGKLVVLTGGSEAAGFSHRRSIAQYLEEILNQSGRTKFRVLNLSMNSYTTSNEINAYVHLAWNLKPDFVISHSGANDFGYGRLVPPPFRKLGMFYLKQLEFWPERLYNLQRSFDHELPCNFLGIEDLVSIYAANLKRYEKIVLSNGGRFLAGIQKGRIGEVFSETEVNDLRKIAKEANYLFFNKDARIELIDRVHSTEASARYTAERYAGRILADLAQRGFNQNLP